MPQVTYDGRVIVYYKPEAEDLESPPSISEEVATNLLIEAVSKAIFGRTAKLSMGVVPVLPLRNWADIIVCVEAWSELQYGDTPQSDCQKVVEDLLARLFKLEPPDAPPYTIEVELRYHGQVVAIAGGTYMPSADEKQFSPQAECHQ